MQRVTVYLTDEEAEIVKKNAAAERLSVSRFMVVRATVKYLSDTGKTPVEYRPVEHRYNTGISPVEHRSNTGTWGDIGGNGSLSSGDQPKRERKPTTYSADFLEFWSAYPYKDKKPDAFKAWQQTSEARPDLETVKASIERWKLGQKWRKNAGEFIPLPASWLRGESWDGPPEIEMPSETERPPLKCAL